MLNAVDAVKSRNFGIGVYPVLQTAKHTGLTLLSAGLLLVLAVLEHKVISGRISKNNLMFIIDIFWPAKKETIFSWNP